MTATVQLRLIFVCVLISMFTPIYVHANPLDNDGDGVIDEFDMCPDTSQGAIIVNPTANPDYAGCTCEQIEELFNLSTDCYFCYGPVLTIKDGNFVGEIRTCPDRSYCEGTSYYRYEDLSFSRCDKGLLVQSDCGPFIEHNSTECPKPPARADNDIPVPVLEGRRYDTSDATITIVMPDVIIEGEEFTMNVLTVFKRASRDTVFDMSVVVGDTRYELADSISWGEDYSSGEETPTIWALRPIHIVIEDSGMQEMEFLFTDRTGPLTPQVFSVDIQAQRVEYASIITGLASEYDFIHMIYSELVRAGIIESYDVEEEITKMTRARRNLNIDKQEEGTRRTLIIEPKEQGLKDVRVIEYIPKEVAEHINEIEFTTPPHVVILEDPLIMWHFDEVEERHDLSYDTQRDVQTNSNTVITASEVIAQSTRWNLIIPLIILPVIVVSLVILPRFIGRKKKE